MAYSGVIFDFNGTLFWDTKLHNKAWNIFSEKYHLEMDDDMLFRKMHGKNNKDIFPAIFGRQFSDEEMNMLAEEKEELYRQLCLQTDMQLAPGAERFLGFLKENEIPFTIATASDKGNLDFYFEHLPLNRWFNYDKVVYNNGKIKGKPNPDIYLKAMSVINRQPQECVVFEDAIMGLQAARNAEAGKIIVVNSYNDDYSDWQDCQIIKNYDEVSRSLFV